MEATVKAGLGLTKEELKELGLSKEELEELEELEEEEEAEPGPEELKELAKARLSQEGLEELTKAYAKVGFGREQQEEQEKLEERALAAARVRARARAGLVARVRERAGVVERERERAGERAGERVVEAKELFFFENKIQSVKGALRKPDKFPQEFLSAFQRWEEGKERAFIAEHGADLNTTSRINRIPNRGMSYFRDVEVDSLTKIYDESEHSFMIPILNYAMIEGGDKILGSEVRTSLIFLGHSTVARRETDGVRVVTVNEKLQAEHFSKISFLRINAAGNSCANRAGIQAVLQTIAAAKEFLNKDTMDRMRCRGPQEMPEEPVIFGRLPPRNLTIPLIEQLPAHMFQDNLLCKIHPILSRTYSEIARDIGMDPSHVPAVLDRPSFLFLDKVLEMEKFGKGVVRMKRGKIDIIKGHKFTPYGVYFIFDFYGETMQFNLAEYSLWQTLGISLSTASRTGLYSHRLIESYTLSQYYNSVTRNLELQYLYTDVVSNATQLDFIQVANKLLEFLGVKEDRFVTMLLIDLSCSVQYQEVDNFEQLAIHLALGKKSKKHKKSKKYKTKKRSKKLK